MTLGTRVAIIAGAPFCMVSTFCSADMDFAMDSCRELKRAKGAV